MVRRLFVSQREKKQEVAFEMREVPRECSVCAFGRAGLTSAEKKQEWLSLFQALVLVLQGLQLWLKAFQAR